MVVFNGAEEEECLQRVLRNLSCWVVFVRLTPEICLHKYTHANTQSVYMHVCVYILPLTKDSKGEYFWGEIGFMFF